MMRDFPLILKESDGINNIVDSKALFTLWILQIIVPLLFSPYTLSISTIIFTPSSTVIIFY